MATAANQRSADTEDEIWLVQHPPVYTQGQAGKPEHLLNPGSIPVVQTDRGGQVTYHGPGQVVIYPLIDLRRLGLGVRDLVTAIEQAIVEYLADVGITGYAKADAPGVYVECNGVEPFKDSTFIDKYKDTTSFLPAYGKVVISKPP